MSYLNEILDLLDESTINAKIDIPIDEILNNYYYLILEIKNQKEFIAIISGFLEKLKDQGILLFMESDNFSEVFWFLQKHYSGEGSGGYERALLDVTIYGGDGISFILEETSASLKIELRKQYLNWIYNTKIIYLPWESKLELVNEIIKQYGIYLKVDIQNMLDEQKALFLEDLFKNNLDAFQTIRVMQENKLFNY